MPPSRRRALGGGVRSGQGDAEWQSRKFRSISVCIRLIILQSQHMDREEICRWCSWGGSKYGAR